MRRLNLLVALAAQARWPHETQRACRGGNRREPGHRFTDWNGLRASQSENTEAVSGSVNAEWVASDCEEERRHVDDGSRLNR